MMELNITNMFEWRAEDYLHYIGTQCPRLRRLEWDAYSRGSISFVDSMLKYLTNPELRATTWPDLECITMDGIFEGDCILQVIETWPIGKLHNALHDLLHRAPEGVVERLLDLH